MSVEAVTLLLSVTLAVRVYDLGSSPLKLYWRENGEAEDVPIETPSIKYSTLLTPLGDSAVTFKFVKPFTEALLDGVDIVILGVIVATSQVSVGTFPNIPLLIAQSRTGFSQLGLSGLSEWTTVILLVSTN